MKHGRIVIYLLIISYIINLGHNFIPHHHHHKDQKNLTHSHHHNHHNLPNEDDEKESNDIIISIFSSIFHHNDDGIIVISSSDNEYKSVTSGNVFGLCNTNSIFENFPSKNSRKHPPENKNYFRLYQNHSHGLRAPPYNIA